MFLVRNVNRGSRNGAPRNTLLVQHLKKSQSAIAWIACRSFALLLSIKPRVFLNNSLVLGIVSRWTTVFNNNKKALSKLNWSYALESFSSSAVRCISFLVIKYVYDVSLCFFRDLEGFFFTVYAGIYNVPLTAFDYIEKGVFNESTFSTNPTGVIYHSHLCIDIIAHLTSSLMFWTRICRAT